MLNFEKKLKILIKSFFNRIGFDFVRSKNSPNQTLLGLKYLPIRTVIDVGANIGQFGDYILQFFPSATIYSFEPLPEPF